MFLTVEDKDLIVIKRFPKILKLAGEYFEWIEDPEDFIQKMLSLDMEGDIFSFVQRLPDSQPKYAFHVEYDSVALLEITTYEEWWKKQINDKTRNMIRRAQKSNIEVRCVDFDDNLVTGIKGIYDESPLRQGKPFRHYQRTHEELKKDHSTFLERSQFIGAFLNNELIGFIKLVHDNDVFHLMQIISKMEHRDKAPTNALLAKAVEICADHNAHYLHYSTWSKRGLGDFKKHHAFQKHEVPRYYVPLNLTGQMALRLGLHHDVVDYLPERLVDVAVNIRNKWNHHKYAGAQ